MAFTFFFRDEQTLDSAIRQALPALRGQAFIHVWDAGCAHGPEPYTLAMLLRERMSEMLFRNVHIHATDLELQFGPQVSSGIFPEEELRRIPADLFQRYFRPVDGQRRQDAGATAEGRLEAYATDARRQDAYATEGRQDGYATSYQVVDEVRSRIDFARHDLLSLVPVRQSLSLIVCKNVLLHFNEKQRCDVLRMFHDSLRNDGLLVMEHTQKVPEALRPLFEQVVPNAQVYRRTETSAANRRISGAAGRVDLSEDRPLPHRGCTPHVLSGR